MRPRAKVTEIERNFQTKCSIMMLGTVRYGTTVCTSKVGTVPVVTVLVPGIVRLSVLQYYYFKARFILAGP